MSKPSCYAGFTLVELAIAIFIMALLLGSILVPLTTQVEQRRIAETQKILDQISDALLGFAATYGYLPCPDLQSGGANDGVEDVVTAGANAGQCVSATITGTGANAVAGGNVPWATLGLGQQDAWGNRFRYSVLETYARHPPAAPFGLGSAGGLSVCSKTACPGTTALTTTAVAVVISHGKNGLGAINAATNAANPLPTSPDEIDNATPNSIAVSRTLSTSASGEFDDLVVWVPKFTLNSRMVAVGRLP